ncbi:MAG: zinc ribbon domain-containing protein [Nanoarchaeota archaeon]
MFNKKRCSKCGEKINNSYNFCPYCRSQLKDSSNFLDDENWGLLGKNDFMPNEEIRLPMGFNALFNSLIKNLNNQFKEIGNIEDKQKKIKMKKGGIGISIYTSGNKPPEIKVTSFGNSPELKEQEKSRVKDLKLPESEAGKFAGLPKKEPETNIRRLSNKVVYEINMPGVKSIKDVSIIQLENSIEIKALAKNKVFYKIIPINLPIRNYNFSKQKLVLELDEKSD